MENVKQFWVLRGYGRSKDWSTRNEDFLSKENAMEEMVIALGEMRKPENHIDHVCFGMRGENADGSIWDKVVMVYNPFDQVQNYSLLDSRGLCWTRIVIFSYPLGRGPNSNIENIGSYILTFDQVLALFGGEIVPACINTVFGLEEVIFQ